MLCSLTLVLRALLSLSSLRLLLQRAREGGDLVVVDLPLRDLPRAVELWLFLQEAGSNGTERVF